MIAGHKSLFGYFSIGWGHRRLAPAPDDEEGNVIAGEMRKIGVEPEKLGRLLELDSRLFRKFTGECIEDRFSPFDAPSREVPSRAIGVTHEKNTVCFINDTALRAQRQAPREAPEELEHARCQGLLGRSICHDAWSTDSIRLSRIGDFGKKFHERNANRTKTRNRRPDMTDTLTIAHISDVHLAPVQGFHPRYWNAKRALGYLNWHRGRRSIHQKDVADRIAADALEHAPDHIAVTGDLANLGLPAEYDAALSWLNALGPADRVTVVPGNHDIYTQRLHGASCLERWADFMAPNAQGRAFSAAGPDPFPFVRVLGGVALIGLNSAVPTPPFVAAGRVGEDQCRRLLQILKQLAAQDLVRVVLIHHPPLPGLAPPRRALEDASALERVLDEGGAELVLHGHNHKDMLNWRQHSQGDIPVLGVASGSASRAHGDEMAARYNLIRITGRGTEARIDVRVRGLVPTGGGISDIAHHVLKPASSVRLVPN